MAFPGEERLRRWGPHWGKARGDRGLPLEGLGARDGGLQWWLHGEGADSGGLDCGGAAPTTDSGWARAGEVHRREEELVGGSFGEVEDRRGELHGSRATAAMGCRGGSSPVAWGDGERAWEDQ